MTVLMTRVVISDDTRNKKYTLMLGGHLNPTEAVVECNKVLRKYGLTTRAQLLADGKVAFTVRALTLNA